MKPPRIFFFGERHLGRGYESSPKWYKLCLFYFIVFVYNCDENIHVTNIYSDICSYWLYIHKYNLTFFHAKFVFRKVFRHWYKVLFGHRFVSSFRYRYIRTFICLKILTRVILCCIFNVVTFDDRRKGNITFFVFLRWWYEGHGLIDLTIYLFSSRNWRKC